MPFVPIHNPKRDYETDKLFWLKCEAVAHFHLTAVEENQHIDINLCKIALLHTAVQQIAIGLIRLFMGYTPNEFSLRFLLELCSHFTTLSNEIFHNQTSEAKQQFKMLCAPPSLLRHRINLHANDSDFDTILTATQTFIQQATILAQSQLEKLKTEFP